MRSGVIDDTIMWIYGFAFAFILISIIFDKQIQKIRGLREINKFLTGANQRSIIRLQSEYLKMEGNDSPQAEARRKKIEQELSDLGAYVVS